MYKTNGHPFLRVNVMKENLFWLMLIFHLLVQRSIMLRCHCNLLETMIGFLLEATFAVSSG